MKRTLTGTLLAILAGGPVWAAGEQAALTGQASVPGPGAESTSGRFVFELLREGRIAERRGDWPLAFRLYNEAYSQAPSSPEVVASLRRANTAMAKNHEALRRKQMAAYVRQARKRREMDQSKRERLLAACQEGRRLLAAERHFEAADAFSRVLEEAPGFEPAMAGAQKLQKVFAASLKRGRFSSTQYHDATEGLLLYLQRNWAGAAESLDKVLKAGDLPDDLAAARVAEYAATARVKLERRLWEGQRDPLMAKALQASQQGRLEEAHGLLEQVVKRNPEDQEARVQMEIVSASLEEVREALRSEKEKAEISNNIAEGIRLHNNSQYTDAMEKFVRVLELDPKHADARRLLGVVQAAMQREGIFVPRVSIADDAEKHYKEGLRLYGNERYEEAVKSFQEALRLNPKHDEAKQVLQRMKQEGLIKSQ